MFRSNYRTTSSIIEDWEFLEETMTGYNLLSNLTILKFKENHFTNDQHKRCYTELGIAPLQPEILNSIGWQAQYRGTTDRVDYTGGFIEEF